LETAYTPVIAALRHMVPMTNSVNFITWDRAYCVFGYQTFIKDVAHVFKQPDRSLFPAIVPSALQSAEKLGFNFSTTSIEDRFPLDYPSTSKNSLVGVRRIGDSRSWIVPLHTNGVRPSPFPSYLIDYASFEIRMGDNSMFGHYLLCADVVKQHTLRYDYVLHDARNENSYFEDQTVIALHLLQPAFHPPNFDLARVFPRTPPQVARGVFNAQAGISHRKLQLTGVEGWEPPSDSGWRYYDDEMLELLKRRYPSLGAELGN
jgi:hypothetical protein